MLIAKGSQLKKVTEVNTPFARNLSIVRDGSHTTHQSASDFIDFAVKTRRDLTQLAQTSSGKDLFKAIESNPRHKVRIQDAGSQPGIRESNLWDDVHNAQRTPVKMGGMDLEWPGSGTGSLVSHHTDITQRWGQVLPQIGKSGKEFEGGVGMSSSLALGHELIHAARGVTGWKAPDKPEESIRPEERETVGALNGSRSLLSIPTENGLRRDMTAQVFSGGGMVRNMGVRTRYGGKDL
jgi:hypothetical protein